MACPSAWGKKVTCFQNELYLSSVEPQQFPTLPELVLNWFPCSTSVIQRGSSLTVEWCRLRLKANHGHLQNQRVVWMVTTRSGTQCLCEAFLEGRTISLWPQRKIQVENNYSSASDDPISDKGLPYSLSPVYAWGPQRNSRAWQAKKCAVIGAQRTLKDEWRDESMNKWTERPFFPGWQCSFCSSEGIR